MNFIRPKRPQPNRPTAIQRPLPANGRAAAAASTRPPAPEPAGTIILLLALLVAGGTLAGVQASEVARGAAIAVGVGLAASVAIDLRRGLRNIVRADLLGLMAFYLLTLAEFLVPQRTFDLMAQVGETHSAIVICLWAFAGLAIGRHLSFKTTQPMTELLTRPVPQRWLLTIFWICFVAGFFHMIAAVGFSPTKLFDALVAPRFSQPWGRGKFGDWKALLFELSMLIYLVPPLAGIMLARRNAYPKVALFFVFAAFLFTLFYGFSTGTRNVFHSFLVTFLIAYAFAMSEQRKKELLVLGTVCAAVVVISTGLMLQFRSIGLKNYLKGGPGVQLEPPEQSLNVDYNLYPIGRISTIFPTHRPYLGGEIFYHALIRPIPRAIWPGKPEGMSMSIEEAVGAEGWTVAASFAGEAYMSGGILMVIGVALGFGYLAGWWNRLASPLNSEFGILIFASGFFAIVISMRSLLTSTTAMLPTLAALFGGSFLISKGVDRIQQLRLARAMELKSRQPARATGPVKRPLPQKR